VRSIRLLLAQRGVVASLFLVACSATLPVPILPLFAVYELGGSPFESSMFFVADALVGMILVPIFGRLADKYRAHRLVLAASLLWLAVGAVCLSFSTSMPQMIAISALFYCCYGVPSAQIFALAKKKLESAGSTEADLGLLRVGYIAGWVAGPALAGLLIASGLQFRQLFMLQALAYLGVLVANLVIFRGTPSPRLPEVARREKAVFSIPVLMLYLTIACALGGDIIRTAQLPLLLVGELGGSSVHAALAFSIVPAVEIPAVFLSWWLANRFGHLLPLMISLVVGACYFLLMAVLTDPWAVVVVQAIYAVIPAFCIGVGIGYAQSMLPGKASFATSLVLSAQSASVVLGSLLLLGLSALNLGQNIFLAPVALCVAAVALNTILRQGLVSEWLAQRRQQGLRSGREPVQ